MSAREATEAFLRRWGEQDFAFAIMVGTVGALLGALIAGPGTGLLVGGVLGLVLGLLRLGEFALYLVLALAVGFVFAGAFLVGFGRPVSGALLLVGVTFWMLIGIGTAGVSSAFPGDLRTDRRKALIRGLVATVPFSAAFGGIKSAGGVSYPPIAGLPASTVDLVVAGLAGGVIWILIFTRWGRWLLARLWLPMTGRLPWALGALLRDGHRRGVLRREGAVYQFRHARLQDRLARGTSSVTRRGG